MTTTLSINDEDKKITARFIGAVALCDHLNHSSTLSTALDVVGVSVVNAPKRAAIYAGIRLAIIVGAILIATQGGALLALGAGIAAILSVLFIFQIVAIPKYFLTKRKINKQMVRTATDLGMEPSDLKLSRDEHLDNFRALVTNEKIHCKHKSPSELLIKNMMPILRDRKNPQNRSLPTVTCSKEMERLASKWPGQDPVRVQEVVDKVLGTLRSSD